MRRIGLERFKNFVLDAAIRGVENLRDGANPTGPNRASHDVPETLAKPALDLLDHARADLLDSRDAFYHFDLLALRQPREDVACLVGGEMRQHEGDGLRVLVMDRGEEFDGFGVVERRE